jgi:hypothetical protein
MTDQSSQKHNLNSATTTASLETSGNASTESSHSHVSSEGVKEELCLSELYALLQSSVSTLDESPHKSLDTLTLLMEQICSQQEALQAASPPEVRLEFWRQVNATWLFVIESILKSKALKKSDWKVVCETIIAVGNVLSLYGLIDYPLGFSEYEILSAIFERVDDFSLI